MASNEFYPVLSALPFLFLINKAWVQLVALLIALVSVIICVKRTGILLIGIVFVFWIMLGLFKGGSRINKFFPISMIICFVLMLGFVDISTIERGNILMERIESVSEDGGSGRTRIWSDFLLRVSKFETVEILLGKGWASCQNDTRNDVVSFHNDIAENFYSFGLLGLFMLFFLYSRLAKIAYYLYRRNVASFMAYLICVLQIIIYGLVGSMFRYTYISAFLFAFLGIQEGKLLFEKSFKKIK